MWWQKPVADQGVNRLTATAIKREQAALADPDGAWRAEWREVRYEQLLLQGEHVDGMGERLAPGRPESVEWLTVELNFQISTLTREHGFRQERAIAYTLLACAGVGALARAARGAVGRGGGGGGGGGGDGVIWGRVGTTTHPNMRADSPSELMMLAVDVE